MSDYLEHDIVRCLREIKFLTEEMDDYRSLMSSKDLAIRYVKAKNELDELTKKINKRGL